MATTYEAAPTAKRAAGGERTGRDLERVRAMTRVLDHKLVDPLMGLFVPGVGDLLGSLVGMYAVFVAWRRKMSKVVIARMLINLTLDLVFGLIPLIGDAFDFMFKANQRNAKLLLAAEQRGGRASARDWVIVIGAALIWMLTIALVIYGFIKLLHAL